MQKFHTFKVMYNVQELDLSCFSQSANIHIQMEIKNCWTVGRSFSDLYVSGVCVCLCLFWNFCLTHMVVLVKHFHNFFSRGGHFLAVSPATSYFNSSMCTPYEFNNREKLLLRKLLQTFCPLRRKILLVLKAGN